MCKKTATYKVDEKILSEFNKVAKDNALNKSQWVENMMKAYIMNLKNEQ